MPRVQVITPEGVSRVADELQWSPEARERALRLTLEPPPLAEWRRFLDGMLLSIGVLALCIGSIWLVTANWDSFGELSRFLVVDFGILGSAALAYRKGLDTAGGRWALTFSANFVGAFLGLFAQSYPSGAEPYLLPLGWSLLILPWCLSAAHPPLWAGWVLLANLAFGGWNGRSDAISYGEQAMFNLALASVAQLGRPGLGWPEVPWTVGLGAATLAGCVFRDADEAGALLWLAFVVASAIFSFRQGGQAKLAGLGFSLIVVDTWWAARSWFSWREFLVTTLVLAAWVMVQVSLVAAGLRYLAKRKENLPT